MTIRKSQGTTRTEHLLANLCQNTFLKLWSYANPYREDGKELCDLIAVFDDHVFLFFDRESRQFDRAGADIHLAWTRWHSKVVDKQIRSAHGAARYIKADRAIFLDAKHREPLPIRITSEMTIHKVIVAHGAREACQAFSNDNVYGSLAMTYRRHPIPVDRMQAPFVVTLDSRDIVHVLDSHNLEILLGELDTFVDLLSYIEAKENAVRTYDLLAYCGEEDLLAYYFASCDEKRGNYGIGVGDDSVNGVFVEEGEWRALILRDEYSRRKEGNRISYFWDELIQKTCQNALAGTLLGNSDVFWGKSALREMAREPRFTRRALSSKLLESMRRVASDRSVGRRLGLVPSFYKGTAYVLLVLQYDGMTDYDKNYRPTKQRILEIACGVARNRWSDLSRVIGIGIDVPTRDMKQAGEDFILLECEEWSTDTAEYYRKANEDLKLFEQAKPFQQRIVDFPTRSRPGLAVTKVGRNDLCPCGSGKKVKRCCA